jgi:hypothetical protein
VPTRRATNVQSSSFNFSPLSSRLPLSTRFICELAPSGSVS